jgi:hypothetical protein
MMMSNDAFIQGLNELYQGEVVGEAIFNSMLSLFDEPGLRYKIAVMFQLETETKARLRPTLMQLGMDITEQKASRDAGLSVAASLEGKDWNEVMLALREIVKPYVERYKEIAAGAPQEYQIVAESMAVHEESLYDFIEAELAGDGAQALADIVAQLHHVPPAQ